MHQLSIATDFRWEELGVQMWGGFVCGNSVSGKQPQMGVLASVTKITHHVNHGPWQVGELQKSREERSDLHMHID